VRVFSKFFLLILSSILLASNAGATDRVLTIYFAGTGMTWNDYSSTSCPWNQPELLATLYKNYDNSVAIGHDSFNLLTGVWPPMDITDSDATHFKYFINGAGTSALTMSLIPELRLLDLIALLGTIEPNIGARTWHNIEAEALNGLIKLLNKHPTDQVILNLVGFSRGGISALRVAHFAAEYGGVKKINILTFDPVPGGLDPVATHGTYFVLDEKVNQYVGIYAEDERSYPFEPVIPRKSGSDTSILLVRTPGSHETMMGNRQYLGHSVGLNLSGFLGEVDDFRVVAEVSQVIVEQLFTSVEWGSVPLTVNNDMYITGGVDTKAEFNAMVTEMWNVFDQPALWPFSTYHVAIQQTGFIGPLFGGRDLLYTLLNKGHELRVPTIFSIEKRLVFVGDERRPFGGWVWGYGGLGAWVLNSEVVYWLEDRAPRITASTWDTLQAFRGSPPIDSEKPVPNIANLPAIEAQCSVTISEPPKATDNVDGVIKGTTTDPLSYSEQGEYTITWTYTDKANNSSTQSQQVIVRDTLAPGIENISASPNVLWPPNRKMSSVFIDIAVTDNCDTTSTCRVISVTSNEPQGRSWFGNRRPDWRITGDHKVELRAEKNKNGDDRRYVITEECMDSAGNSSSAGVFVTVPHDRRKSTGCGRGSAITGCSP